MITDIQPHFPKERPDLLYAIEEGGYYGHPNPSRDECIFFAGNPTGNMSNKNDFPIIPADPAEGMQFMDTIRYEVGVQSASDWKQAIVHFGLNKSVNGIIEYNSQNTAFCGRLDGELLVNYFNQADQIRRVKLDSNGLSLVNSQALIRSTPQTGGESLSNPLPIVQDDEGRIIVGEFGTNDITIFEPVNVGLWSELGFVDMPVALLDAGSGVINDILYAVAGKTSGGPQRTLYSYSYTENSWTQLADMPTAYPAVENPAVAVYNNKLYVFGGATAAFSGAVDKTAVYDPITNSWTELPAMPTARGGATAQTIGDLIYVAGGMNADGESVATLEIYNPATNTWSSGPDLSLARDNAGSAAIAGKMYVFGGRVRNAGGEVDPTLNSVEIYDPNAGWSTGSPMPTGRRTMTTVVYDGRAIVMGGERTDTGGTFVATEAYDPVSDSWQLLTNMPVGRHGAVAGLLGDMIIVGGGGTIGGTDFTNDLDGFFFDCAGGPSSFDFFLYVPLVVK
jgi:N-acetylneuraminic acid mutarotase